MSDPTNPFAQTTAGANRYDPVSVPLAQYSGGDPPRYYAGSRYGDPFPQPPIEAASYDSRRYMTRTPSPTPSERNHLEGGPIKRSWSFWIRREWAVYYVIGALVIASSILITVFHQQIVDALKPFTNWMKNTTGAWLVPIGILFVLSFPPLFGHEIVAMLCGLTWGIWIGFGIVAAGTFLGEIGNFYAFKYCCTSRAEKYERTNIWYACFAKIVKEGGFLIVFIARISALPPHFTTAVFSTCGMNIFVFSLAALLSMPKQLITVYLGVMLGEGQTDSKSQRIQAAVVIVSTVITVFSVRYLLRKMKEVKPQVIYERRKARQAKMAAFDSEVELTAAV
ncbi:hypothetical protein C8J56DRAFT_869233 [Mycena floridula]|nr:hypothetical protein C8J56DRAFT_869233 [Mycena floridula]